MAAVRHRLAVVLDRPEALAAARPQLEALAEAGHEVHLGIGGRIEQAESAVADLCRRHPTLSVGYAIARRDGWTGVAAELREQAEPGALAAALPPDEGVRAYLRQLDLDLVLLAGEAGPASFLADYASACRSLGLACAPLAERPEDAVAQAAAPAAAPPAQPASLLGRPALWAMRARQAMTRPLEDEVSSSAEGARPGLKARLGEAYAQRLFPGVAGLAARLAPASRPLLKARLERQLGRAAVDADLTAEAVMARAAGGEGPVVFGPWSGDPALELLYWIPFLRWCRRRYRIEKERIICVSSGDAGAWYEGLGSYLDLSEMFDADAQRALERDRVQELQRRGKTLGTTEADRQIFRRLDRRLAFRGFNAVPPWALHLLFERYWSGEAGPLFLAEHARHQPLKIKEKRARQLFPELPQRYVAMSFDGAANFPDTAENRAAAAALVRQAGESFGAAVLTGEGHESLRAEVGEARGVRWIELDPVRAKGSGSAVVAGALGFVGAQNWLAYAAGLLGKPAVCFEAGPDARQLVHRATAAAACQPAPLVLGLGQAEALAGVLDGLLRRDTEAGLRAAAAH